MEMEWFPKLYIMCNSKQEPKRYEFLLRHLPQRRIPMDKVVFIEGPWASEMTTETIFKIYDPFFHRLGIENSLSFKSNCLTKGELSLINTFYKTIQIASEGEEICLIFESDVILREDFIERLEIVLKDDSEWDYISLGEGCGTRTGFDNSYFQSQKLFQPGSPFPFRCCDSMLFRKSFLKKLVPTFIPVRECLDWELDAQIIHHRGKALWAEPPLVEAATSRSRTASSLPG
jgi:hypothetical protein